MFKGTEIKKLVLVSTLCCVLLIVSVSLYLILSSRNNLREQTDRMKMAMAEEIAGHLQTCFASMSEFLQSDAGVEFDASVMLGGDPAALVDFFNSSILGTYDADFIIYKAWDGMTLAASQPGLEVPDLPADIDTGGNEYVILNELGGRQGTFFLFEKEGILPGDTVIYAIDNTAQVDSIKQAYRDEKDRQTRQQVVVVAVLFLLLLALSLVVIHFSITRLLGRPMSRLSEEAREIVKGKSVVDEEVREGSIFANLQRLLNSGRVLLARGGAESDVAGAGESPVSQREVNMVILVWAAVTTLLFLAATVIMLLTSISLMNSKAETILENVGREMADYYSNAYDSLTDYAKTNVGVYVGGDIWDPEYTGDRQESINRLTEILRYGIKCDAAVSYVETAEGGKYFISLKEGAELKEPKPDRMGDSITIYEDYYEQGDLVIVNMNPTGYPGMGKDQFLYYVVDVTPQAGVLEDLYRSGSSSLLRSQLWLSLLFLALCLALSPLAMAWATMHYITRPILELDAVSEKLIEGDLDVEIAVDERSSFADIQRLLLRAREMLKSADEA